MKTSSISILIAVAVIATILIVSSYAVINNANAPLATRQDKTVYTPKATVVINAETFNGNIEIQSTTGSQIEIIYNVAAPSGFLPDIKTATDESKTDNTTTLVTSATNLAESTMDHKADILIKVPNTSQYNLTLTTANGNIIKPQLNDIKVLATTKNGDLDIKDGGCAELDAMSMNGNVKVSLTQGTLFQVTASTGNGNINSSGIALTTSTQTATRLNGATSGGNGTLTLGLLTGNGNITIEYLTQ